MTALYLANLQNVQNWGNREGQQICLRSPGRGDVYGHCYRLGEINQKAHQNCKNH